MAFDHTKKLAELENLPKQAFDRQGGGSAGQGARQRTKTYLGLGEAAAENTRASMEDSIRGVKRIYAQSTADIRESRGQEVDLQMAAWIQALGEEGAANKVDEDYDPFKLTEDLYGKKGGKDGKPVAQSYFNDPLIEGGIRGNSRKSGDISPDLQQKIVNKIIDVGGQMGMSDYEIAYALAIARYESGFNPDAASTDSSASGIGQFINTTGANYGITNENRWDIDIQVQALVDHTVDNFETARKKGYGDEYVYALHHDGPKLNKGGLAKGKENVMPYVSMYLEAIERYRRGD